VTETEPDAPNVPGTPLIVTLVAAGTFQLSVDESPGLIEPGDGPKEDAAAEGQTVTATSDVGAEQGPLATMR
jgi:hypothetical protein